MRHLPQLRHRHFCGRSRHKATRFEIDNTDMLFLYNQAIDAPGNHRFADQCSNGHFCPRGGRKYFGPSVIIKHRGRLPYQFLMVMLATPVTRRKPARGVSGKVLRMISFDPLEKAV